MLLARDGRNEAFVACREDGHVCEDRASRGPEPGAREREYGDVEFADPLNNTYPIDTPKHPRAAWSQINHKDAAATYDMDVVATIKDRIERAAKKHDIDIEAE